MLQKATLFCCFRNVYFLLIFKGFVDALDEERPRRLLVLVLNNGQSLDYARRLLENDEDPEDDPQPYPTNNGPRWCTATTASICPPRTKTSAVSGGNISHHMNCFTISALIVMTGVSKSCKV